jgi:hypothetical protein
VPKKGTQQVLATLHGVGRAARAMSQDVKIDDGVVGERIGLEIGPEVFDRVELWGVRREVFQMCRAGQDALVEEFAFVGLEAIPDKHDRSSQLPLQMFEEIHGALGGDVGVWMQPKIQSDPVSCWQDAQRGDGGHFLMAAAALPQYGSLATHAPGAPHHRRHEHPRFVEEDDRCLQARGVFFTRGQSCSIQARMRCSSRSTARRVGFWGVKPRPCSRRLTCAG